MISTIGSQSSSSAERKHHGGRIVFSFAAVFPKSSMYLTQGKRKTNICRVTGWMGEERLWLNQPIYILICLTHTHTSFCIIWDFKDGKLWGFPGSSAGKESSCNAGDSDLIPGKIPWRREWLPTLVFWPGEFHGQRSLADYSPWGWKELDITVRRSRELQNLPAIAEHLSVLSHILINYSAAFREKSCIIKKEFDRIYLKAWDLCRKQKPIQVTKEKE